MTGAKKRRVAVVGSGVSGLLAAHVLARTDHVTLYEADARLGGHADTHDVDGIPVDTGFIVHNDRTYPTLLRLFTELGVTTQESDMSMSVRCDAIGLEYAGARGLRGLFPSARNLTSPRYLRMLTEVRRFHRRAREALATQSDETLDSFLEGEDFSPYFRTHFMTPLVAAVWSCDPGAALEYPARYLFSFLDHHGMLTVFGSPTWRTVVGGSHRYVERVAAGLDDVRLDTKVTEVAEEPGEVVVVEGGGAVRRYDAVVVATHADQALAILAEPTSAQREVLGAIPYSRNLAQLHSDTSMLPRNRRARASWNYQRRSGAGVLVTYDLGRLQRLGGDRSYLLTLNGADVVDPATVIATMEYAHPLYTPASVAAQARLPEIDTERIAFAGAYHGWGFHEDGALAGLRAAEHLGGRWTAPQPAAGPRIYDTTITHARQGDHSNTFRHRSRSWLVDVDNLPHRRGLATFEARDHVGDPDGSLRGNIETLLASHTIAAPDRILMLANARGLGYVFNPISVFWCYRGDTVDCVVLEVHNTYGARHAYVVRPDERGRARIGKRLYVSPFNDVSGEYDVLVPPPTDRVHVAVTLRREGMPPFSASLVGHRAAEHIAWASPATALAVAARIRMHGIALWARGLPIHPRADKHNSQERS